MSLHEMMTEEDEEILSLVSDYKLNLIAPGNMTDEELDRFTTSLREVMLFIKYSKDKERLHKMIQNDKRFKNVERQAATVMSIVTGTKFEVEEEEDEVDMCEAIKGLMEDAVQDAKIEMARRMLAKGKFSDEEIAEMYSLTVEEVRALTVRDE